MGFAQLEFSVSDVMCGGSMKNSWRRFTTHWLCIHKRGCCL